MSSPGSRRGAEPDPADLRARLMALPPDKRMTVVGRLSVVQQRGLNEHWPFWAHDGQHMPTGAWRVWIMQAGRGWGKTRAGAEWVSEVARQYPGARIALVAATIEEGRRVMVEGDSGILAIRRGGEEVDWRRDRNELVFASQARAFVYSAERPESLRGPQHDAAWCDELAKWRYGEAAWSNLLLGLRLGETPQVVVTTTPKPAPLMRQVLAMKKRTLTGGSTRANVHLPDSFVADIEEQYAGTRLGRQELDGELIEDREGALWTRAMLDGCLADDVPTLVRVVVGVDPPASAGGDACGIVAAGLDADGVAYVLEDASVAGLSPDGWARAVAECAARVGADRVIAEKNQGGDMVETVLRGAEAALPVRLVHASRGKLARAEPVAAEYERGKVRHVRGLAALEDELCGMVTGGVYAGPGRSPDRADALVWAVTELLLGKRRGKAGVRGL
ncbi:MAG: ATP-binding protein [Sphingomonas bacterium]|uniref:DNA-packaging protein n=1 Tax=Sphingomonas bacterium TaxID=1895847 RepID=UPI002626D5BB|nr:terminase family protein [Sphingomonas bacterium]MDB5696331.1 ATP-binding protein [Sphingomonas bacterium]